ncbi:hypothetical protein GCM10009664_18090 [Kitasatospora gansuensis]
MYEEAGVMPHMIPQSAPAREVQHESRAGSGTTRTDVPARRVDHRESMITNRAQGNQSSAPYHL